MTFKLGNKGVPTRTHHWAMNVKFAGSRANITGGFLVPIDYVNKISQHHHLVRITFPDISERNTPITKQDGTVSYALMLAFQGYTENVMSLPGNKVRLVFEDDQGHVYRSKPYINSPRHVPERP